MHSTLFSIFFRSLILTFLVPTENLRADTVRATNLASFASLASNETIPTVSMFSEISSGVGDTKDNPIKIYIPLHDVDQAQNTTLSSTALMPRKKGNGLASVMFSITMTNSDVSLSKILNLGVQDGVENRFETFIPGNALAELTVAPNTAKEINILVTLDNICNQVNCSDVDSVSTESQKDFKLFLFLDNAQNSNTDKDGDTTGLFVTLKFSSQVPDNTYTFDLLTKGDERLFANLSSGQIITFMGNDIYKTYVHKYAGSTIQASQTILAAGGVALKLDFIDPVLNGQVKITGLTNGVQYNLAFGLVNKYQFVSPLTPSLLQAPEDILALLNKQACYLVTAGFGREHLVLDRIRLFRDEILLASSSGTQFVNAYYKTAPIFVPYILNSEALAWVIRTAAYFFYFILEYTLTVFISFLSSFFLILFSSFYFYKKQKTKKN